MEKFLSLNLCMEGKEKKAVGKYTTCKYSMVKFNNRNKEINSFASF